MQKALAMDSDKSQKLMHR